MSEPAQKCENYAIFKEKYTLEMFIAFQMAYFCCFSLGGNLFQNFYQKKFYSINYRCWNKKVAQFFYKSSPQNSDGIFYFKLTFIKVAKIVAKYLGHSCKIISCHDHSKIPQSGHAGSTLKPAVSTSRQKMWIFFSFCSGVFQIRKSNAPRLSEWAQMIRNCLLSWPNIGSFIWTKQQQKFESPRLFPDSDGSHLNFKNLSSRRSYSLGRCSLMCIDWSFVGGTVG